MRLIYGKINETYSDESVVGRALLLAALSDEGISVTADDVVKDSLGKPYLPDRVGVEFNITHKMARFHQRNSSDVRRPPSRSGCRCAHTA